MSDQLLTRLLAAYGLAPARLFGVQKGYRNESHPVALQDGRLVNLIIYKSEPGILGRIKRANAVADFLATQGWPTRRTLDPRIIQLQAGQRTKYSSLYAYLDGNTIPWEAYTRKHLRELGRTMSDLHGALRAFPGKPEHTVADEYAPIFDRMQHYFAEPAVQRAMHAKLGLAAPVYQLSRFSKLLEVSRDLPHQQPLHLDFVRGNILFSPAAEITGILDFEKTAWGHPIFDIGRTLAFLLVDCKYKPEADVRKYFLFSGYNRRGGGPLKTSENNRLLEELVDLFLLHDFYKFLRHNPYEALHANEHYLRTEKLLVRRGVLSRA